MSRSSLVARLVGRDGNGLLWRLLLLAAVLQVALPAHRELALMMARPGHATRLVSGQPTSLDEAERTAAQVNQAWAWIAAAERGTDSARPTLYEHAVRLAPDDEVVLIRRAVGCAHEPEKPVSLPGPPRAGHAVPPPDILRPAAEAAIRRAPDNAVGWYLLAAAHTRAGAHAKALAAVARGNRAPRCDDHSREAMGYVARLSQASGLPAFESWLTSMSALMMPHLAAYRQVAREAVNHGATPAQRLEIVAMGARLRDDSRLLVSALVGVAIQQIAIAGPADPNYKSPPNQTKEQQAARRRAQMTAFATTLRDGGQAEQAAWVEREFARNEAAKAALANRGWLTMLQRDLDPHLAAYGAWAGWLSVTALAALLLLGWALLFCTRRRATAFAWRARDLVTVWCAALLPFMLLSGLLAQSLSVQGFATLFGGDHDPARAARLGTSLLATIPLPLLCTLCVLRVLSSAYRRRHPELTPRDHAAFGRGAARSLLLPTAALLLLLAWAAQGPAISHRNAVADHLASRGFDETVTVREAMDQAGPARARPHF